jgi:hypothetical protein
VARIRIDPRVVYVERGWCFLKRQRPRNIIEPTGLEWPAYGWVAAALILVILMTIQGLGFLTPVNVLVCLELQKDKANMTEVSGLMQRYFYVVALQGIMQVAIIVVITRFRVLDMKVDPDASPWRRANHLQDIHILARRSNWMPSAIFFASSALPL